MSKGPKRKKKKGKMRHAAVSRRGRRRRGGDNVTRPKCPDCERPMTVG